MEVMPFGIRVASIEPGVVVTPIWGKRSVQTPEGDAYARSLARLRQTFISQMEGGTTADVVADAIYRAADQEGPIHVPVGADAEVLIAARNRTTTEQWASIYTERDEPLFTERLTALCGVDILNPPSLHARRAHVAQERAE